MFAGADNFLLAFPLDVVFITADFVVAILNSIANNKKVFVMITIYCPSNYKGHFKLPSQHNSIPEQSEI